MTSYDQTRPRHDACQKTSDLKHLGGVWFISSRRCPIYDVLKTSNSRCLEDVWFTTSRRHLIYVTLKTSNLRRVEDIWFTTSWRSLIYDVLKTSKKWRLCSNVVTTSVEHRNNWLFLIFSYLKYSENFNWLVFRYEIMYKDSLTTLAN